ncbi:MAG: DUF624 domain-containing protein [Anaerolineae bacterium]|nr:DUF624 domain-containing protein [Anaerolineae bacterium]
MKDALRVFAEAVRDTYDELPVLVTLNVLALLLVLPLVTAPPAVVALWAVGNRVARGEAVGAREYWAALRRHFGRAWLVAALHAAVLLILVSNLGFYHPASNPLGLPDQLLPYIQGVFVGLAFVWLLLSQYLGPLLLEQEDTRARVLLRNAAVLLIARPGFAATLLVLILLVALLSTLLTVPWLLITPAFLAVLTNNAVLRLLAPHREK